jgi:hypothetical protein
MNGCFGRTATSIFRVEEKAEQETTMKQIISKATCFWKAWVCIEKRRDLQDDSLVPIGCLREKSEPMRGKTRITSVSPENGRGCCADHYINFTIGRSRV